MNRRENIGLQNQPASNKRIHSKYSDKEIAEFILALHTDNSASGGGTSSKSKSTLIPIDLLRKYIKYAKHNIKPKLTTEAVKVISDFYIKLRKLTKDDGNAAIAVVARNLEGFIRISEAYAKMALKSHVSKEDAEEALKFAKEYEQKKITHLF